MISLDKIKCEEKGNFPSANSSSVPITYRTHIGFTQCNFTEKIMLPSKSMMEYFTEMNRLFPRPEMEESPTPFPFSSDQLSYQSAVVNRSSSSADSTSPESYPDLFFRFNNYRPIETRIQDTPFSVRPQRAIVGRKILGSSTPTPRLMSTAERMERDFNFWQQDESLSITPPGIAVQPKSVYELFPSESSKAFEFKTPVKSEAKTFDVSPNFPDRSPLSNNSPIGRNLGNLSPRSNQSYRSPSYSNQRVSLPSWSNSTLGSTIPSQRQPSYRNSSSSHHGYISQGRYQNPGACSSTDEIAPSKMCTFCRKNGETPIVYMTHNVKELVGNQHVVTCPILRSHVCATCGAFGDDAHTITYCPVLRNSNHGRPLQSTTITLKNTRIKSNGKRRF